MQLTNHHIALPADHACLPAVVSYAIRSCDPHQLTTCIHSANHLVLIKCLVGSGIAMVLPCITHPRVLLPQCEKVAGWLAGELLPSNLVCSPADRVLRILHN